MLPGIWAGLLGDEACHPTEASRLGKVVLPSLGRWGGLGVSKLGSEYGAVLVPAGGSVLMLRGGREKWLYQFLCPWRGLP